MITRKLGLFLLVFLSPIICATHLFAAPKEITGKSIILNWSESREQRPLGETAWRTVSGPTNVVAYVGETGRVFGAARVATAGGTSSRLDKVSGAGNGFTANFSGNRLVMIAGTAKHVRRLVIDFDSTFSTCNATVNFAKQSGAEISQEYSTIINRMNEIRGAQISGVSCSVRPGNALAGG